MKVIIEDYEGVVLDVFNAELVEYIRYERYFDIDTANEMDYPNVKYIDHFEEPITKSSKYLVVYLQCLCEYHIYNAERVFAYIR